MSARQERNGRKFGEQGRAAVDVLHMSGIANYTFAKPGKHAEVAFTVGGEDVTYRFACTPRSAGGAAKTVRRDLQKLIDDRKARGTAAVAAPEKTGGQDQSQPPERHSAMLQESMVLPAANSKAPPTQSPVFSVAHAQRARRAQAWLEDRMAHARANGVFTETVEIDPVLAELLLALNHSNRAIRQLPLSRLEDDIRGGRWELNGETIKVSLDGQLNDGQHRLQAVVNTGTAIKTLVTFGLPRDSRLTVDQGANRTAGDYLGMSGVTYANHAAAVANLIWQIGEYGNITRNPEKRPTKTQVTETYHAHPKINESIRAVPPKGARLVGGISTLAFCHYLFSLKNTRAADAFISSLVNGEELKRSDPIQVARRRLMEDGRLTMAEKIEIIFRTWNAVRTGRTLKTVPIHHRLPSIEN